MSEILAYLISITIIGLIIIIGSFSSSLTLAFLSCIALAAISIPVTMKLKALTNNSPENIKYLQEQEKRKNEKLKIKQEKEIKKQEKKLYPLKNFLRPIRHNRYNINFVLANKYCFVELSQYSLTIFDKTTSDGYCFDYSNGKNSYSYILKTIFKYICKEFNFETKIENVDEIISNNFHSFVKDKTQIQKERIKDYKRLSINNMSVAELIELPGINIGKANKIQKYLRAKNKFNTKSQFIQFANVSPEMEYELQRFINKHCKIDISRLK